MCERAGSLSVCVCEREREREREREVEVITPLVFLVQQMVSSRKVDEWTWRKYTKNGYDSSLMDNVSVFNCIHILCGCIEN